MLPRRISGSADGAAAAILLVGFGRPRGSRISSSGRDMISVPLERVHREVEVGIKNKGCVVGHGMRLAKRLSGRSVNDRTPGL